MASAMPTYMPNNNGEMLLPTAPPSAPPPAPSSAQPLPATPTVPVAPPAGLKALIDMLRCVYPDQPNPLQVTTLLKYWLGGEDPLDYISMYNNLGDPVRGIPSHWHYVSFGLSDLHGDGRVHPLENDEMKIRSGMGFELTFRLQKNQQQLREERENPGKPVKPPTWPANLLQSIARYCFQTGNNLCFGDNIPWRKSLDGKLDNGSRLQNILIAQDAQLGSLETPFGMVDFCQIIGVMDEELEQASRWNGRGVLNYLRQDVQTGGEWLVTNMDRTMSVFELFPERLISLQDDLEKQGSDLAGVNAEFTFREVSRQQREQQQQQQQSSSSSSQLATPKQEIDSQILNAQCVLDENNRSIQQEVQKLSRDEPISAFPASMSMSSSSLLKSFPLDHQNNRSIPLEVQEFKIEEPIISFPACMSMSSSSFQKSCSQDNQNNRSIQQEVQQLKREEPIISFPACMSMSSNSLHKSCPLDYQPQAPESISLDGIEITLAPYAAKYLMLAIKDRIRHGRHFTFKSQHLALTFVAESVTGSSVTKQEPYGIIGYWIQVLIPDDLVPRMMADFDRCNINGNGEVQQRLEFDWPDKRLKLIIDQPSMFMVPPPPMNL